MATHSRRSLRSLRHLHEQRTTWLAALLLLAGCGSTMKADVWVTPRATLEVDGLAGASSFEVGDGVARISIDDERGSHHVRFASPGRSAVVGTFEPIRDAGSYALHSTVDAYCSGSGCAAIDARHPLSWLVGNDGPFELPRSGEGVVVTCTTPDAVVIVTRESSDRVPLGTPLRQPLRASRADPSRQVPAVIPLDAGVTYRVDVEAPGKEGSSIRVVVVPGTYELVHAALAQAREHYPSLVR